MADLLCPWRYDRIFRGAVALRASAAPAPRDNFRDTEASSAKTARRQARDRHCQPHGGARQALFTSVSPDISLGYRRNVPAPAHGPSVAPRPGADWVKKIAISDDLERADDRHIFSYWQAVEPARQIARRQPGDEDAAGHSP